MFTGLIEEIGIVKSINKGIHSAKISIHAKKVLNNLKIGDSISTNGVCLTVTQFDNCSFSIDVMPETMRKSNLKNLKIGSKVNLERALKLGDRFGGHIVSGHIDGTGIIKSFKKEDNATWISIKPPRELLRYIVYKGSITIDGISLTVAYEDDEIFNVSVIPLTGNETTLLTKKIGEEVNIECDIIGKYVEKFSTNKNKNYKEDVKNNIDVNFLKNNGFI
ncbi:riboflavin synthase [Clostridium tepidiprofundi DSM 19306]|uniref:Riboflavin synthase n=1 Tax=Clostridium tepidiprofundi DSM 19306 TaxID=1121338 RepID=A0A151B690_9CLOT|nr:riboflavin synthase [Clostridium tepidiprofundi]KYH35313.1 riboflavin synthase [Clostridium tepidiprofundi DSM 19306]